MLYRPLVYVVAAGQIQYGCVFVFESSEEQFRNIAG